MCGAPPRGLKKMEKCVKRRAIIRYGALDTRTTTVSFFSTSARRHSSGGSRDSRRDSRRDAYRHSHSKLPPPQPPWTHALPPSRLRQMTQQRRRPWQQKRQQNEREATPSISKPHRRRGLRTPVRKQGLTDTAVHCLVISLSLISQDTQDEASDGPSISAFLFFHPPTHPAFDF